jgi:hypothetical protein
MKSFKISALQIPFGRKEFEEYIELKHKPEFNRKGKRGEAMPNEFM